MPEKHIQKAGYAKPGKSRNKGNKHAVTNGLSQRGIFANAFAPGSAGEQAYQAAKGLTPAQLALDAAHMLLAQIQASLAYDPKLEEAKGAVAECLRRGVAEGIITAEHAQRSLKRLSAPTPEVLAKAMGPLRGLLAKLDAEDPKAAGGPIGLIVTVGKTDEWANMKQASPIDVEAQTP